MARENNKHETITTIGDLKFAIKDLNDDMQLYVQGPADNFDDTLYEITVLEVVLAKDDTEESYFVMEVS